MFKISTLESETLHSMELALDTFYNTLEPLEECIGKMGYYPDWNARRQIYRKTIEDSNDTAEGFEDLFLTNLFITKTQIRKKPDIFRKKIRQEFYKWISATRISSNNCPDKLKHFLYEINEVLEGRGDNIVKQTRDLIRGQELTPQEALGMFGQLNHSLNRGREREENLKGKKWNYEEGVEGEGKIKEGNPDKGERTLKQICQEIASKHDNYDLFSEQKRLRGIRENKLNPNYNPLMDNDSEMYGTSQSFKQLSGAELAASYDNNELEFKYQEVQAKLKREVNWDGIDTEEGLKQWLTELRVEKIKRNIKDWKIDEVVTFNGHYYDWNQKNWIRCDNEKKVLAIIQKSAEKKYNEQGGLVIDPEKMFLKDSFDEYQWLVICHKIAQRKVNHPNELESWENYDETVRLVEDLENRMSNHHSPQQQSQLQTIVGGKKGYGSPYLWGSLSLISLIGIVFVR